MGGVMDLRYFRVGGEPGGDQPGVLALAGNAQGQGLEAPMGEPGPERREDSPDELAHLVDSRIVGSARYHDPGRQVAVAAEVLGGAVDHDVRAELQRPL